MIVFFRIVGFVFLAPCLLALLCFLPMFGFTEDTCIPLSVLAVPAIIISIIFFFLAEYAKKKRN